MTAKAKPAGLRQTTIGGGHQYWLGDEGPFPGVTTILRLQDGGSSDGLVTWAVNTALQAALDEYDVSKDRVMASVAGHNARNAARDLGTNVHHIVEAINLGNPVETTADTAAYAAQYAAFLVKHRVEVVEAEAMVVNRTLGYGGSYDLLARIGGRLALVDIKTGKDKPLHRLQLAAYGMAEVTGKAGEDGGPMPKTDAAYVLLLRADSFELVEHRVTKADREHFADLARFYQRIKGWTAEPVIEEEVAA